MRVLFLPLAILLAFLQPERPDVSRRGTTLVMRLPAELLEERKVARQLATALTTTFLLEIRTGDGIAGVAEIRVRYDLWEEEFVVLRRDFRGEEESSTISDRDELREWWSDAMPLPASISTGDVIEVELVVLPFSLQDEGEARDWLARSGGVSSDRTRTRGIIEALVGTTLRARPLARHQWKVRLVEESR